MRRDCMDVQESCGEQASGQSLLVHLLTSELGYRLEIICAEHPGWSILLKKIYIKQYNCS